MRRSLRVGLTVGGIIFALAASSLALSSLTARTTLADTGAAQATTPVPTPGAGSGIMVSGMGQVQIKPDVAVTTLGVDVTSPTLADAQSKANTQMTAVIDKVKSLGVADKDIQTIEYSVTPITSPPKEGSTPAITGYRVSNQISIKIRQLGDLGKILDAAVSAGANSVMGISFGVDSPQPYQAQARQAAVKDAMDKASQLAQAANVQLGPVLDIGETSTSPQPLARAPAPMAASGASVPIETGQLTITVNVQMRFAIH